MKRTFPILCGLLLCFFMISCGQSEDKAATQPSAPDKPVTERSDVAQKADQLAEKAQQKVSQITETAQEKVAQATEQAKEKVTKVTDVAQEKAENVASKVQSLIPGSLGGLTDGKGKKVYANSCASCHDAGILGAPKTGDKSAWAPLIKKGTEPLTTSVIQGKGRMPAKGGNRNLTAKEIRAAVNYMVEQGK